MNKKRIILGLLIAVMAVFMCGVKNNAPAVFATEISENKITDEAGTYSGEGWHVLGSLVTLKAEMNPGYKFDMWKKTSDAGVEYIYDMEAEFEAEENVTITPFWHKIAYTISVDGLHVLNSAEMNYFLQYGADLGVNSIAFCSETQGAYVASQTYKLEENADYDPTDASSKPYKWTITNEVNIAETLFAKFNMKLEVTKGEKHKLLNDVNDPSDDTDDTYVEGLKLYLDKVDIIIEPKDDVYVYDIAESDIKINNNTLTQIKNSTNTMVISNTIVNDEGARGFETLTLNVGRLEQSLNLTANVEYMHKLTLESGNEVTFEEIKEFIGVAFYYSELTEDEVYLVRDEVIVILNDGNDIYQSEKSVFNDEDPTSSSCFYKTRTLSLTEDSVLKIFYSKKGYTINFATYVQNESGNNVLLETPLYNIPSVQLTAGENIELLYDSTDKSVTIDGTKYDFPLDTYGYNFVGFEVNDTLLDDGQFTLSETEPANTEIQIVFEYIEYDVEIKIIDEYFNADYGYTLNTGKLVKGTQITFTASTEKFQIVGWSLKEDPTESDYLVIANEGDNTLNYICTFEPESDETYTLTMYLDITYRYLSVEYSLANSSIGSETITNLKYDIVKHNEDSRELIFIDSSEPLVEEIISYEESDKVTDTDLITIDTKNETFGNVVIYINDNTMTYGTHGVVSEVGTETDGVWQYSFENSTATGYVYYGSLKATVVEAIEFTHSGTTATFSLIGTQFSEENASGQNSVTIEADVTLDMIETDGAYKIDGYHYTMYFYPSENRISLRGINFYKDGDTNTYKLQYSARDRENISATIEKDDTYSITLNNLLENHIVVYQTISLDEDFYQFSSFKNKNSSTLWSFVLNDSNTCYLKAIDYAIVVVNYNKLSQSILLRVNNELAYKDAEGNAHQIEYSVNGVIGTGAEISAIAGEIVVISIEQAKIAKGYKFVQFRFMNNVYQPTISEERYTYSFTMDESYANKYFDIEFEQIKYNLNILYIDKNGNLITDGNNKGSLKLQDENLEYNNFSSGIVTIENEYKFKAVAEPGYYVARAYIGAEAYTIESLQSNNDETSCETVWILSLVDNVFQTAICDNTGEYDNENDCYNVNLKIYFAIHTYSVKVCYVAGSKAELIDYPTLTMNGVEIKVNEVKIEGGVTEYFAYADGFEYNSAIELVLSNFMTGTKQEDWKDGKYNIDAITGNMELDVTLQYEYYTIIFEAHMDGQKTNVPGSGNMTDSKTTHQIFDKVNYAISTTDGYKLQKVYFYDASNKEKEIDLDETSFRFDPANFLIDGNLITIYLVFDFRTITLQLSNQRSDGELNPLSEDKSAWLTFSGVRIRDGVEEPLEQGYTFRTEDTLILNIKPKYIGIELDEVHLGVLEFGFGESKDYSVTLSPLDSEKWEEGYTLIVYFNSSIMAELYDVVSLVNYVKLRTYNIDYSYNLISFSKQFRFGVKLSVGNATNGTFATTGTTDDGEDLKYTGEAMFNSNMTFSYDKGSLGNKFVITGFKVCGKDYEYDIVEGVSMLILDEQDVWNSLALDRFLNNSNVIQIVLMLTPKIELNNADSEKPYIYNNTYNAREQGLVVGRDIIVVEGFTLTIKYNDSEDLPINAGNYKVLITVTISGGAGSTSINFDEDITYIINPAKITITISEPLVKVYDGTNTIGDKQILVSKLKFNGICEDDQLTVDVNKLTASYADNEASDELIAISINNLILLEKTEMIPSANYVISNGKDIVLDRAGKITHRELFIGFIAGDKVFDNTDVVHVNTIDILVQNKVDRDSVDINVGALKFYLDNFSVGFAREVKLDLDAGDILTGDDSENYIIKYGSKGTYEGGKYKNVYIDIYPNEISYTVKDYGTFKIVDADKKCLIPINANMVVKVYENGSEEFQYMYSKVQLEMDKNEKMKYCYKVALVVGGVEQMMKPGLQIYLPKAKKTTQLHQQTSDNENIQEVKFASNNDCIILKTEYGRCVFAVVVDTTFLPLWAIILIVAGSLLAVGGVVTIFIVVRVRAKRKYGSYDKI